MKTRIRRSTPSASGNIKVRSISLGRRVRRYDTSRQVEKDHTTALTGGKVEILPPFPIENLLFMKDQSNTLRQCIAAMVTNVGLCGWEIVRAHKDTPMDPAEVEILQSFIDSPNSEESLTALNGKMVDDKESLGFAFLEVIRDRRGNVAILRHAKSSITRLCPKDEEKVAVAYDVVRGPRTHYVVELRTFRRYTQMVGGRRVYFKEFGDPRDMDYLTGDYAKDGVSIPPERLATEIIHIRKYSDDEYGLPCWINQIPSILGSREAEEVNLRYFQDNTVPPMMLTVAGGRLTAESHRDLKRLLNAQSVGKERQNQILLIEAVPETESLGEKGNTIQLKVDKLTDARPSDGLFKQYDDANQAKIRSSFRLPPVAIGLSQDVTFATANVSMYIAEAQVYAPERTLNDEMYNKFLVHNPAGLGLKTVALRSRNPTITNPEAFIKSLTALNVMGAVTPRSAQKAFSSVLDTDIDEYPEKGEEGYEEWMDQPIALTLRTATGYDGNHDEQALKDNDVKKIEEEGDPAPRSPEHGQE